MHTSAFHAEHSQKKSLLPMTDCSQNKQTRVQTLDFRGTQFLKDASAGHGCMPYLAPKSGQSFQST